MGNDFTAFIAKMAEGWIKEQEIRTADWFEGEILYCGKCKEPRRERRDVNGTSILTTRQCLCDRLQEEAKKKAEAEKARADRVKLLKEHSMMDEMNLAQTFDNFLDNEHNVRQKKIAIQYCEKFPDMLKKNTGLLFWGGVGNGKTFLSACIANRLIENLHPVVMTSFNKLLGKINTLKSFSSQESEEEFIERLNEASLWIIDDLGTERDTTYALEKVYQLVNSRYNAQKPILLTTNLTMGQMMNESNIRLARIYDRIFEMCYPVEFKGPSMRRIAANRNFQTTKQLLEQGYEETN